MRELYYSEHGVCGYVYYMLSHSRKDDLDDLTQKGSKFNSEHVLGTKENIPKQVLWTVAGNDGDWDAGNSTARERRRANGEREWVGAVTQTPVTLVARTERPTFAVLGRIWPVTHHRWGRREGWREEEEDTIFLFLLSPKQPSWH